MLLMEKSRQCPPSVAMCDGIEHERNLAYYTKEHTMSKMVVLRDGMRI